MSFHALRVVPIVAVLALTVHHASAQSFVLEFGQNNVVAGDGSTFRLHANSNTSFDLQVFLTQIAPESRLSSASSGLAFADLLVDVSGGPDLVPTNFTLGPGFQDDGQVDGQGNPLTGITGQMVRLAMVGPDGIGRTGVTAGNGGTGNDNSVLLGTITYSVGSVSPQPTFFRLTASGATPDIPSFGLADPGFPVFITVPSGSGVVAVPEPSAFALAGLGALGLGYRYRRQTKAGRTKETRQPA